MPALGATNCMVTMVANPLFIDTNVLVYATRPATPWHTQAQAALVKALNAKRPCFISGQVIREYYATMTRPDVASGTLSASVEDVLVDIAAFQTTFTVLEDTQRVLGALLTLVQTTIVGGRQIHDANIVATMIAHGIGELLTHNGPHFARFNSLITIRPLEA